MAAKIIDCDQPEILNIMNLQHHITDFTHAVGKGFVEIYNEFSLQHELGVFLRSRLSDHKVQFERNVSYFNLIKKNFLKREIDISVISTSGEKICALELKYPRNGQVPESMFGFCKDIAFLEQLVESGFQSAYFLAVVDHKHFYSGASPGIYGYFRAEVPITGTIIKPTGLNGSTVTISGCYSANWVQVLGDTKFCLVHISPKQLFEKNRSVQNDSMD